MEKVILDASVVIKWFTEEQDSDKAVAYLKSFSDNTISIVAPSLIYYELGNILLNKKVDKKRVAIIKKAIQDLHLEIQDIGIEWFDKIYKNSFDYSITFYDSAYLTLMENRKCAFVTADKKLYEKAKKKFSKIKLL